MPSKEVNAAVGEAGDKSLEQRAAELRRILEQPTVKDKAEAELREIERQIAETREADARLAAEKRMLGCKRAVGSVIASIEADDDRILETAKAFVAAAERVNARYSQYQSFAREDGSMRDRFTLDGEKLPFVIPPEAREKVAAAARMVQAVTFAGYDTGDRRPTFESCEHGLRVRRTYEEVSGTPSAEIIQSAGLKPWPELTERQRERVAALGRQQEASIGALAELAVERTIATSPWPNAGVQHG